MEAVYFKQQFRVVGPDGTQLLLSNAVAMNILDVYNHDLAGTPATAQAGEGVVLDSVNATLGFTQRVTAGSSLPTTYPIEQETMFSRISAATDKNWLGVLLDDIAYTKTGRCAGIGSILGVQCVAAPTSAAAGDNVIGSSTAGKANFTAGATTPASGILMGRLCRTPTQMGGASTFGWGGVIVGHP